jgi:hypothetical protein
LSTNSTQTGQLGGAVADAELKTLAQGLWFGVVEGAQPMADTLQTLGWYASGVLHAITRHQALRFGRQCVANRPQMSSSRNTPTWTSAKISKALKGVKFCIQGLGIAIFSNLFDHAAKKSNSS